MGQGGQMRRKGSKINKRSGIRQGLVLGQALFKVFVGNMNSEIECTLNKFANDIKLCDVLDILKEHLSCEERLRQLGLFSLEKKEGSRETLQATFQYLKGAFKKAGEGLFTRASSNRTRSEKRQLMEFPRQK